MLGRAGVALIAVAAVAVNLWLQVDWRLALVMLYVGLALALLATFLYLRDGRRQLAAKASSSD